MIHSLFGVGSVVFKGFNEKNERGLKNKNSSCSLSTLPTPLFPKNKEIGCILQNIIRKIRFFLAFFLGGII
jgi:hypothetical protein